jgi:hypothetical protein
VSANYDTRTHTDSFGYRLFTSQHHSKLGGVTINHFSSSEWILLQCSVAHGRRGGVACLVEVHAHEVARGERVEIEDERADNAHHGTEHGGEGEVMPRRVEAVG